MMRHLWNLIILCIFAACIAWCAAARADLSALDPAARPDTRFGPHYLLALDVSLRGLSEKELCKTVPLDNDGAVQLTVGESAIEKIRVGGLTARAAAERIKRAIARYYAVEPDVRVGIARIPRLKVTVNGATFRQGSVVLVEGSRLQDALNETGFQPSADLSRIEIARLENDGTRTTLRPDFSQAVQGNRDERQNPELQNGDVIAIPLSAAPPEIRQVQVVGEVANQGTFLLDKQMTVRDALEKARGLLPTAEPNDITLLRLRTGTRSIVSYERVQQNAPTDNLPLRDDDVIIVGRKDTGRKYSVTGAVALPQTFEYQGKPTLKQAIAACGGLKPDADARNIVLARGYLKDPAHSRAILVNYDTLAKGGMQDPVLEPGDWVQVPQRKHQQSPLLQIGLFFLRRFLPF
jgi:protein involved in polysaccharide export with SLBB domain